MDVQLAYGSDILMVLDECPEYPVSHEYARAEHAAHGALGAAGERHFLRRMAESAHAPRAVPDRAGLDVSRPAPRMRRASWSDLDTDGYAIGGLSVGEPRPLSLEVVEATEEILPRDKPRYAMGVGMPAELPEYVARGMDMMDCVLPSRNARNGYLFTSEGRVIIKHARYKDDQRPVDPKLPVLYLPHLFPGVSAPSVSGRGDVVFGAGDPSQHPAVP